MAQFTANYNLAKPLVGGDINLWGGHWNVNADKIDVAVHGINTRLATAETNITNLQNTYINKDGSVAMTGRLTLSGAPLVDLHAVTKSYADTNFLTKTGTVAQTIAPNVTYSGTQLFNNNITLASGKSATFTGSASFGGNLSVTGGTFTSAVDLSITAGSGPAGSGRLFMGSSGGWFYASPTAVGWYKSGGAHIYWDTSVGNLVASGDITAYSDERLKDNIRTIEQATDLVRRMRGVWFTRVDSDRESVGVIAQEMQRIVPEVVHENDGTLSVAYGNLVGVLIETIKEMDARIKKLECR